MADIGLDTILATLLGVQKDAEAESPWTPITDATDLIGKTLIQASPNFSLQENILAGLLTGAVGGLGKNLTKSYAEEQSALAEPLIKQVLQGNVLAKPKGLSDHIFNKYQAASSIFEKTRELEALDRASDVEASIAKTRFGNPLYEGIGGSSGNIVKAENTPGGLAVNFGAPAQAAVEISPIQSALKKALTGNLEDLTEEEATAISGASKSTQSLFAQYSQQAQVSDRFGQNLNLRKGQLEVPNYVPEGNFRLTAPEAAKLRTELATNAELKNALAELGKSVDEQGFLAIAGTDAKFQGALAGFVFNTYRKATNSGARLEGPEAVTLQNMTPETLTQNPTGALKALMLDRDPAQFARDMIAFIDRTEEASMKARGFGKIQNVQLPEGNAIAIPAGGSGITPEQAREQLKKLQIPGY